jgi:hypothetical protein
MRLVKFLLVVIVACFSFRSMAQSQSEETGPTAFNTEKDITKSVHIFPNPATEFVHVKLDQFPASKIKLTLHNIIGNQIEIETEIVDEHEIRVKVKDLASGYYLLAVKEEEAKYRGTFKFLKR